MKDRILTIDKRKWIRLGIFSLGGGILFAAFDRCGYMLKNYGSIWAVSENPWHRTIWMRILCRLPAYTLAVLLLLLAVQWLRTRKETGGRIAQAWQEMTKRRYWFFLMWTIYFISFLPAFLGGFPGLFAADAPNQIGWTFSGWLTAHHPLLHTGILCGIFSAVRALGGSDNLAAAVYTILQMLAMSGIFAWISRFLNREHAPVWLQAGTVLFLCPFPFPGMMAIYTTKDTLFAGIFVLSIMQVWRMCVRPEEYFSGWRRLLCGGICFSLLLLFRNNGFHTIILCAPFLLVFLRKYWKKLLLLLAGIFLVYQAYNGPFLKMIGAEEGNPREALSVIMQTLGRTYAAGGDIRPEEMDVIRPVLDEETLALYTPDLSDSIKNYFHTEAFQENAGEFLETWLQIGLRNKKIYADAFLNTTYAFWYPGAENEYLEFVCFDIEEGNPDYPHVHMEPVSELFNRYGDRSGIPADSGAQRDFIHGRILLADGFCRSLCNLQKRIPQAFMDAAPLDLYGYESSWAGGASQIRVSDYAGGAAAALLDVGKAAVNAGQSQLLHPQSS